jgi:hypothetical protein
MTERKISREYAAALQKVRMASLTYHQAIVAYRTQQIDEQQFSAAREAMRAAEFAFDAVWERERGGDAAPT